MYAPPSGRTDFWSVAAYTYKCRGRPWVLRLGAVVAAAVSAVIVWSEATIGSGRSPDLSPFRWVQRLLRAAVGLWGSSGDVVVVGGAQRGTRLASAWLWQGWAGQPGGLAAMRCGQGACCTLR